MQKWILFFIFWQANICVKPVFLEFTNEDQTQIQNISMYWDFTFNRICVADGQIDCSKVSCKLKQSNIQYYYHNVMYTADVYQMNILIENENKQKFLLEIDVDFVTKGYCLALGLGPQSSIKNILNDQILMIDPFSSNLSFVNQEPEEIYQLDVKDNMDYNKASGFVMDSALSYNVEVDYIEVHELVNNTVLFCLNPYTYKGRRNYFFQVIGNFVEDWEENRRKFESYILQLFIRDMSFALQNEDRGYIIPYDLNLFKAYDGYPMRNMELEQISNCEGYLGDYFYERSGMKFYITSQNNQNLIAKFDLNIQPYRFAAYTIYKTILLIIWFALFAYLIYLAIQKNRRKNQMINQNHQDNLLY